MKLDDALALIEDIESGVASVIEEGIARWLYGDLVVSCAETVREFVGWEEGEVWVIV